MGSHLARQQTRRGRRRRGGGRLGRRLLVLLCVLLVLALGLAAAVTWRSGVTLAGDSVALARVEVQPLGGSLVSATAYGPDGVRVPLSISRSRLLPRRLLAPGETVTVVVTVRRPGWLAWALGHRKIERLKLRTPTPRLIGQWLTVPRHAPVQLHFAEPVTRVSYRIGQRSMWLWPQAAVSSRSGSRRLPARPRSRVPYGAGSGWAIRSAVSWFPVSSQPVVLVSPPAGGRSLRCSDPADVFAAAERGDRRDDAAALDRRSWAAGARPTATRCSSRRADSAFRLPLRCGSSFRARPRRRERELDRSAGPDARLDVAGANFLRLQQLLAELGYLPLSWSPTGDPVRTAAARRDRAARHSAGRALQLALPEHAARAATALDSRAAEHDHPRGRDDVRARQRPGRRRHRRRTASGARCSATRVAGKRRTAGYSYVYVHRDVPQLLDALAQRPDRPHLTRKHRRAGRSDRTRHLCRLRAHPGRDDERASTRTGRATTTRGSAGSATSTAAKRSTPSTARPTARRRASAASSSHSRPRRQVWPYTPIGTLVTIEN